MLHPVLVFWRFSRPHTVIGTVVGVVSISLCAASWSGLPWDSPALVRAVAFALVPSLLLNVYITGLNQVYDVEIDKTNKPYLPIPAGDLSRRGAALLVAATGALSIAVGIAAGTTALQSTLLFSFALGTAYSVPPLRFKRFPSMAAFCIVAVRGAAIQVGFFLNVLQTAAREGWEDVSPRALDIAWSLNPLQYPPTLQFSIAFITLFALTIALLKDVPDIKGDAEAKIRSYSVRFGARFILLVCSLLLVVAYGLGTAVCVWHWSRLGSATPLTVTVFHAAMAVVAPTLLLRTPFRDPSAVYRVYMCVWAMFYVEYLVFPAMCASEGRVQ